MQIPARSKLAVKFVALVVGILTFTLLINANWFIQRQQDLLKEQLLERSRLVGHNLSHVSIEAILARDFTLLGDYVRDASQRQDIVFSIILDKQDIPLTNYFDAASPLVRKLAAGREFRSAAAVLNAARQSPSIEIEEFPILERGTFLGSAIIGISRDQLERDLHDFLITQLLIYSVIIIFLSLAIYLVFHLNVLRPIIHLIEGSERIAQGNYENPVEVSSGDELGHLAETFNSMMGKVSDDRDLLNLQANFDGLTGLPNRVHATERLSAEIKRAEREKHSFAIIFIDLDNFKYVNDTMGHRAGDQLLEALSQRLSSALRESDVIARLGGDEFLVILPTASRPAEGGEIAQRLVESLGDPIRISNREIFIRCSMGIAIYPTDGHSADELMANADNAMYQSKLSSTEHYSYFAPEMNQAIKERLELEHDLHLALDRQQFKLHFQPIIEADGRTPIGAEALLRWHHPERGQIPPFTFIPLAEATGQIVPIGRWVLNNALQAIRDLLERGIDPGHITVNVSRIQLTKDFAQTVQKALDDANLPPHRLRLELTESALIENCGELPDMLHKLHTIGVKLVLDDFGTGFSSLNYLKHFPFHTLKIDKSFTDNVPDNESDASLVRGIIAMSSSLGLNVVAEGVEYEHQYRFLFGSGVEQMQGYLFARPMTIDNYQDYLRQFMQGPEKVETIKNKLIS
jgi:diguanylate cyclase (GGDEF)-like protein